MGGRKPDRVTALMAKLWEPYRSPAVTALNRFRKLMRRRWGSGKYDFSRASLDALRVCRRYTYGLPDWRVLIRISWFCEGQGWLDLAKPLAEASEWVRLHTGHYHAPDPLGTVRRSPLPPEPDDYPRTPQQLECEALMSRINFGRERDPDDARLDRILEREALRDCARQIRTSLVPERAGRAEPFHSQESLARRLGLSRATLSRLENLERDGSYQPARSTLAKLADVCQDQGWQGHLKTLEKATAWHRGRKSPERKRLD